MAAPRPWFISEALHSFRRLKAVLDDLTEEEVLAALKLETGTLRRSTLLRLLEAQAAKLNTRNFNANLKENIHGTQQKHHPE